MTAAVNGKRRHLPIAGHAERSMSTPWRVKDFLEAGKKRLAGNKARAATSDEVKDLRREASALKEVVAELTLENRLLKKKRDGSLASQPGRRQGEVRRDVARMAGAQREVIVGIACGGGRPCRKLDYDVESRLQLFVLIDSAPVIVLGLDAKTHLRKAAFTRRVPRAFQSG